MNATERDHFWEWFGRHRERLRAALLSANSSGDLERMQAIVDVVQEALVSADSSLTVVISLPTKQDESARLVIRSSVNDHEQVKWFLSGAPHLPGWDLASNIHDDPPVAVVAKNGDHEIRVPYAALEFEILWKDSEGRRSVLLLLDEEFDPSGPLGHLYQAAASQVLATLLGGHPPDLGTFAMLPRAGYRRGKPIAELARTWRE